ncbi:MAG: T9SS type A sorting domain-containing protein, partial [Prevotellaceae bacterium]|nr:T9SS type A sorting domain-containing protein [Prevotellaceae bacterium]
TWSVTPDNVFQLYYSTGNSVMLTLAPQSSLTGQAGTLTATVNGFALTKAFQVCFPHVVGLDTIPVDVCAATYTLAGVPDDSPATLQWKIFDCGGNTSILIGYGAYSVFDKTTANEQPCTEATIVCALRMTINGQNYPFFVDEKIISIPEAPPATANLVIYPGSHPLNASSVTSGPSGTYTLIAYTSSSTSPLPYRWAITGPDGATQILYGSSAIVTFSITGTYTISLSDSSSCWPALEASTTFTVLPTYSLYPNPVTTGILNIAPVSGSTSTFCLSYTIRSIATGVIVLQGQARSNILTALPQINVSTLSSGLYLVQLTACSTGKLTPPLIQADVIVIP